MGCLPACLPLPCSRCWPGLAQSQSSAQHSGMGGSRWLALGVLVLPPWPTTPVVLLVPPEFRPGEPWKGYPNIDPETDPYITPGSVTNNLSINTVREADHLRDRNNGMSASSGAGTVPLQAKLLCSA